MPKRGQEKGTPARRAALIEELRQLGEGPEHVYWPWSEAKDRHARVYVDGVKIGAHRWVYEQIYGALEPRIERGAIGDELVLHKCGVKPCIRPSHLYIGNAAQNSADALRHGHLKRKLSDLDVEHVRMLYQFGVSRPIIGATYGINPDYVGQIAADVAVMGPPAAYRPKQRGHYQRNVLTPDDVHRIRRLCDAGAIQARLAEEYGVTRVAINHVAQRKTWRHLPEEATLHSPAVQA